MEETFELEIATPERLLLRERVVRCQIPGKSGYFGVLPGHAALLSELGFGALTYVNAEERRFSMAIHGGYVEVLDNHVRVLADLAERSPEIDLTRAEKALRKAQDEIINPALGIDIASALTAALRADARDRKSTRLNSSHRH